MSDKNTVPGTFRMNTPTIMFTPEKLAELKRLYKHAQEVGKDVFVFEGQDVLVDYAKYMIEFLEHEFKIRGIK